MASKEIDNAFRDLSSRSTLFRARLVEEFQLLDNINNSNSAQGPVHASKTFTEDKVRKEVMNENPSQLIKFKTFKRPTKIDYEEELDRRLTRTSAGNSFLIGAWAGWVVKGSPNNLIYKVFSIRKMIQGDSFQTFLLVIIVLNAIFLGVTAELSPSKQDYVSLFDFISILDIISLIVFVLEIALKWTDDFKSYWNDWWNITDFIITAIAVLPEIIGAASGSNNGSSSLSVITNELKVLRILRTLKLIVRFGSLRIIILTITEAFKVIHYFSPNKSLSYFFVFIAIVTYVYAVVGVIIFFNFTKNSQDPNYYNFFDGLGKSFQSMFQFMTNDGWAQLHDSLMVWTDPLITTIYVLSWLFLSCFIFRQIFCGVMVNYFQVILFKSSIHSKDICVEYMEKRKEYLKAKKFQKMRKRLNDALAMYGSQRTQFKSGAIQDQNKKGLASLENLLAKNVENKEFLDMDNIEELVSQIQEQIFDQREKSKSEFFEIESQGWLSIVNTFYDSMLAKTNETVWPRDSLFKYFQLMEKLQENLAEYQELQMLAGSALLDFHDD